MRAGVFLCECGGNISGRPRSGGPQPRGALARRRRQRGGAAVPLRHRGPPPDSRRRRGARPGSPRDRQLLAPLPGTDLRAHRPRPAAGRERRRLRQPARGLLVRAPQRAGAGAAEGAPHPARRRRPRRPSGRPAAAAHLPAPLGAGGRRRHRRHDRRRGAGRQRHRGPSGGEGGEPGWLHGSPLQDLPDRGLRHVQPRSSSHRHGPQQPHPHPHAHRRGGHQRPARRVPREAQASSAVCGRDLRGLRRVHAPSVR